MNAPLALPTFAPDVPMHYTIPGIDTLTVPLTIALLEADVISNAMLRAPRNALLVDVFGETEKQLCESALTHWWTRLVRANSCKFFRWELHVQHLEDDGHGHDKATTAWFCFDRMDGEIPRFALSHGIERLEAALAGFGQTVLAVLREATQLLPDSFTPWVAIGWAERLHWDNSGTDQEMIEDFAEMNGVTVENALANYDLMTRAKFFANVPEWVCRPRQVVSRAAIGAAGTGDFERCVIEVCDALHALVSRPDFVLRPQDKGAYRCGHDTVDGAMVLLWNEGDVIGQVIDDYLEQVGSAGDYCEFVDANPVTMTAAGIRDFQIRTEQTLQVAVLTEQLILLLGEKF